MAIVFSRRILKIAVLLQILSGGIAGAGAPNLNKFPLRVQILKTAFKMTNDAQETGRGLGNILDGQAVRGFDYEFVCDDWFDASRINETYPARWKKKDAQLEIVLPPRKGKSSTCTLDIMKRIVDKRPYIYGVKNGRVSEMMLEEYRRTAAPDVPSK